MPTFSYKAKDKKGKLTEGVMEGDARGAVVQRLQQMGFFPISIHQVTKKGGKIQSAAPAKKSVTLPKLGQKSQQASSGGGFSFGKQIGSADVANFNRQLSDLLGAGVPLVKGLAILNKQTQNEKLQGVIADILDDVQGGATFADALAKHPKIFSKLYVAMVRSGEAGGMLDEILERLADFSENEEQLKSKIKSALAYPVVMCIAGSIAILVMFAYVIPKITETFEELGQTLPGITLVLIQISDFTQDYWWLVVGGIIFGGIGFWQFVQSPEGKRIYDNSVVKVPVMGTVVKQREVARFSRTLGSLLKNGVNILGALEITREVLNNTVFQNDVDQIMEEITQGSSVAKPLKHSPVFPQVAVNMIAIGEETGRLPDVLLRISESYETHAERTVRTLTNLIEPLIIVTMGMIVGFVVIAMLLPIFSLDPSGGM